MVIICSLLSAIIDILLIKQMNANVNQVIFGIMNFRFFIYILKRSDDSNYTGITNDLNRRMNEHESA